MTNPLPLGRLGRLGRLWVALWVGLLGGCSSGGPDAARGEEIALSGMAVAGFDVYEIAAQYACEALVRDYLQLFAEPEARPPAVVAAQAILRLDEARLSGHLAVSAFGRLQTPADNAYGRYLFDHLTLTALTDIVWTDPDGQISAHLETGTSLTSACEMTWIIIRDEQSPSWYVGVAGQHVTSTDGVTVSLSQGGAVQLRADYRYELGRTHLVDEDVVTTVRSLNGTRAMSRSGAATVCWQIDGFDAVTFIVDGQRRGPYTEAVLSNLLGGEALPWLDRLIPTPVDDATAALSLGAQALIGASDG